MAHLEYIEDICENSGRIAHHRKDWKLLQNCYSKSSKNTEEKAGVLKRLTITWSLQKTARTYWEGNKNSKVYLYGNKKFEITPEYKIIKFKEN